MKLCLFFSLILFTCTKGGSQVNKIVVEKIIEKMQSAHGGIPQWKKIKTIYFNHHIVFGTDSTRQWWISREMTELKTMRFYETRPFENATIVYDGIKTWSTNWKQSNPPAMLVNNHLLQQVLPFFASHPMAKVTEQSTSKLPGNDSVEFISIKLVFKPEANFDSAKYYCIFIHPITYRMAGWEYNITHPHQLRNIGLPDSIKSFGPFINKIHSYVTINGILFPEKYDTYNPKGVISGNHLVLEYKINEPFDKRMMKMQKDTVKDPTQLSFLFKLN